LNNHLHGRGDLLANHRQRKIEPRHQDHALDAGKRDALSQALATSELLLGHGARALDASRGEPAFVFELGGRSFGNPDFVKLAEAFGAAAWRLQSAEELGRRLREALALDRPSLIVVPIDYSALDVALSEELGAEIVST